MIMKGVAYGKMYDVITMDEFMYNVPTYRNSNGVVAVLHEGFILPITRRRDEPGIFVDECFYYINLPEPGNEHLYSSDTLIDFNVDNMRDLLNKTECFKDIERDILTSPDNIFTPKRNQTDEPLIKVLKNAIDEKHMDINKYKDRMPQFDNDRRLLNSDKISIPKFISTATALDLKATIILEDNSPDVPNPMNKTISICLTGDEIDLEVEPIKRQCLYSSINEENVYAEPEYSYDGDEEEY